MDLWLMISLAALAGMLAIATAGPRPQFWLGWRVVTVLVWAGALLWTAAIPAIVMVGWELATLSFAAIALWAVAYWLSRGRESSWAAYHGYPQSLERERQGRNRPSYSSVIDPVDVPPVKWESFDSIRTSWSRPRRR